MADTVVVGFSGGVDSVAAAILLQTEGYAVQLVALDMGTATAALFRHRVESAAALLDLPLKIVMVGDAFQRHVIDYLATSYLKALTPNPCIRCNSLVKFSFLARAQKQCGARWLATGHYVTKRSWRGGELVPGQGRDDGKDQSYFLQAVDRELFTDCRFPLGSLQKTEAVALAAAAGFQIDSYQESQELCFVGQGSYVDVLRRHPGMTDGQPGLIVNRAGDVVARHQGIHHFTIGQRRGLGIAHPSPLYVCALVPERNEVVVGERDDLYGRTAVIKGMNWFIKPERCPASLWCQIRYRHQPAAAAVEFLDNGHLKVNFAEPQFAITPGQGAALYDDGCLLGGGWIC
ncbi:MAG: tRNA 2-thiouridine(34) synthase MnmA [Deltaproteobacteria bacterium]|nr:tRNA 2-thiouridine(34) synthase MnmA [Candidatus Anaeroferrophillus wilburensis]MBN2889901.1 tRNA 2-thiouridine(34) synthase MnmA [Deltaproteobacteria bacterium]